MVEKYIKYVTDSKKDDCKDFGAHYEYCSREKIPYVSIRYDNKYACIDTDLYLDDIPNGLNTFRELLDDNCEYHKNLISDGIAKRVPKIHQDCIMNLNNFHHVDVLREHAKDIANQIFDKYLWAMNKVRDQAHK